MTRSVLCAVVALTHAVLCAEARADALYMANGDRITGDIKRVWDGKLFIESEYADEFSVSLDAVMRIESDEDFEIELRDHSQVTGRFAADQSGDMVLVTETGTVPFSPADIEELAEPEDYFDWDARSDLSFSGSSGNSETSDFLWQAEGGVKLGDHRHRLNLRVDRKDQDGLTTKEQYNSSYSYSWFFADRWFLAGGIGFERDPIRQLTYRYSPGVGIGFQFFEDAHRLFEVSLEAVGVRERIAGETNDSSTAKWTLKYRRKVTDDLEFFHDHRLLAYLSGRTNRVADTITGFRWDVWENVYMNAQINWNWESEPAAGNEKDDFTYALGVGVDLD